jgi:hypothetical protein
MQNYRDPNQKEKKPAINTYGLDDNCYYVTAARLLGTTVRELITKTEMMQIQGGASLDEVKELFTAAGLTGGVWSSGSLTFDKAKSFIQEKYEDLGRGLPCEFALMFGWNQGGGHAIVVEYESHNHSYTFKDYQPAKKREWSESELSSTAHSFFVYGPVEHKKS